MTANEPPNPYVAPTAALTDGDAREPASHKPSRLAALAVALFGSPLLGAGLYLLGRPRRFRVWAIIGVVLVATIIVAIRVPFPRLAVFAIGPILLAVLLSVVDTAIARPGQARPFAKPWILAIAFIVAGQGSALAMREWLIEAFSIPSGAMVPTLLVGDHIYVRKGRGGITRGDVIVFKFPADHTTDYIKRVVAVGGDTIQVQEGVPAVNGIPLDHQAIAQPCTHEPDPGQPEPCTLVRETNAGRSYTIMFGSSGRAPDFSSIVVPDGEVFVMGDNRDNSYDSRRWGTVKVELIKGKATMTWWSRDEKTGVRWSRVGRGVE
jgi:signal peptidase I